MSKLLINTYVELRSWLKEIRLKKKNGDLRTIRQKQYD